MDVFQKAELQRKAKETACSQMNTTKNFQLSPVSRWVKTISWTQLSQEKYQNRHRSRPIRGSLEGTSLAKSGCGLKQIRFATEPVARINLNLQTNNMIIVKKITIHTNNVACYDTLFVMLPLFKPSTSCPQRSGRVLSRQIKVSRSSEARTVFHFGLRGKDHCECSSKTWNELVDLQLCQSKGGKLSLAHVLKLRHFGKMLRMSTASRFHMMKSRYCFDSFDKR